MCNPHILAMIHGSHTEAIVSVLPFVLLILFHQVGGLPLRLPVGDGSTRAAIIPPPMKRGTCIAGDAFRLGAAHESASNRPMRSVARVRDRVNAHGIAFADYPGALDAGDETAQVERRLREFCASRGVSG